MDVITDDEERLLIEAAQADPARFVELYDRNVDRVAHRLYAIGDECRIAHQAGAEAARLDAFRRTAAIEVDLVVAPLRAQARAVRKHCRIAAAQLQRHRMLRAIEIEMARHVAMQQRRRGHHLGVQARVPRDEAQEVPAVPVRPVHHGGYAEAV